MSVHELDHLRIARVMAYRVPQAPVLHVFWGRFDAWASALRLSGGRAVAFKVACDQTICNPFFTTCFFMSQSLLEGVPFDDAVDRTRRGFVPTWWRGVQYYGAVHCITFAVIPVPYRIAWNSCAAVA
eukprot:CAMPEP_0206171080 /NCGR_PEP_ID=MMETSP1474-20131121/41176_1 /ASSEMBLY_ACC=CAM_ASM_001110 /TAXON_ID=97495 /ORGANISM="Imantonia sp., Strain RCC918" /LENGTH=126 /DNA_ID=CAMNT_0053578241 /DNA_START=14 /DNA_END=391 /DNA_ORIENTATION=-